MPAKSKKYIWAYIITTLFIIIVGCILFSLINATREPMQIEVEKNQHAVNKGYKYLVKDVGGKINVFETGKNEPIEILDKPTNILPEYDQKLLKEGIYLENIEQLDRLLEDYDD